MLPWLDGRGRERAAPLILAGFDDLRLGADPAPAVAGLERALELDPATPYASFYLGLARYATGRREDLARRCPQAVGRAPALTYAFVDALLLAHGSRRLLKGAPELLFDWSDSTSGRLGRAAELSVLLELNEAADAQAEQAEALLDAVLAEAPARVAATTLRGFVRLRRGRLAHAAVDLQRAQRANPRCPQAAFFRALLLARRGASASEVREALVAAHDLGFGLWVSRRRAAGWSPDVFPELAGYEGALEGAHVDRKRVAPWVPPPASW